MENLISMIFALYEDEIGSYASEFDIEFGNFDGNYIDACKAYVEASGGLKEFDYEP